MPQSIQKKQAWANSEQIEGFRGKERDAKVLYDGSEAKKIELEALITKLRAEDKNCRHDFLWKQSFTVEGAIDTMDQKVCEVTNTLNALKYQRKQREDRLAELRDTLRRTGKSIATSDTEQGREVRRIQNEMDKARMKYEEALSISRHYEAIKVKIQDECRQYPARLNAQEQIVDDTKKELIALNQMKEEAVRSREEATKKLELMEREMYKAKRTRDAQLNETRKDVERRKQPPERVEKRAKVNLVPDTDATRLSKLQQEKEQRQERILTLEEGFVKIMKAVNVSDIQDIVIRVTNQDDTLKRIKQQKHEKEENKAQLLCTKENLKSKLEYLKYTSQRLLEGERKAAEDLRDAVVMMEAKRDKHVLALKRKDHLLKDLQSGIAALYEQLKNVKLKPPYHNFSKGVPVTDLANCTKKLNVLMMELGLKKDFDELVPKFDHLKLFTYLESRLPPENVRIRLDTDDISDEDEFHFDLSKDNDDVLSRGDIKRLSAELIKSKLKPKRKKIKGSRK